MITIPPVPKFSSEWIINIYDLPASWNAIIKHAVIWTLSNEKRFRDKILHIEIQGISIPQFKKMMHQYESESADTIYKIEKKPFLSFYNSDISIKSKEIVLGRIVLSQTLLYEYAKRNDLELFVWLVQVCVNAALEVMQLPHKKELAYKRNVLNKFGVDSNNLV